MLIGHEKEKKLLKVALRAATERNMALPHMMFAGAPGCGKTTTARTLSTDGNLPFLSFSSKAIKTRADVLAILDAMNLDGYDKEGNRIGKIRPSIVFIDEIHNLGIEAQEELGIAMEEFKVPAEKQGQCYWVPYFTLVGATTNDGLLSKPFLDRFKFRFVYEPYDIKDMMKIAYYHADVTVQINATPKAIRGIVRRSRGTPRILVGYLERCRDAMLAMDSDVLTSAMVEQVFADLEVDENGLVPTEIKLLKTLVNTTRPIGIKTLAVTTNEAEKTLMNSIEPYLIREGLMVISGSGRSITEMGKNYLAKTGYDGEAPRKPISMDAIRR